MPKLVGDATRGGMLFTANCVRCHGTTGAGGQVPAQVRGPNTPAFAPALWGPRSFSIGAGLGRVERAAAFIRVAMPYDQPGTLSDQQAFDLAAYVLSHPRPDQPGKGNDWPAGGAPGDVPYATRGHGAYRPPPLLRRTGDSTEMMEPPPASVLRSAAPAHPPPAKATRKPNAVTHKKSVA
jgi:thiosulfate dehydrogenase